MEKELAIAWIDLSLSVHSFIEEKVILNKISGGFDFMSINALMGSSGSGKTTLLKCLNGSNKYCLTKETQIYLNSSRKINSCFIYQDQSKRLLKGLTVKQNLSYASKLKNSSEKFEVNHQNIINDLMNELLIINIADNSIENCSGGQLKRLAIALELTSHKKPDILFIDEATTGLDSNAAEVVIQCLKDLSRKHRMSIITSIHQPNNDLLMMFDKIYVLAKGGVCIYSGQPKDLKTHLNECNIICNEFQVPIEVLLKIASNGVTDERVMLSSLKSFDETLMRRCQIETNLTSDGIQNETKRFKLIDFWHLLLRTMTYIYTSQRKLFLTQLLFYILFPLILIKSFNENIGKVDGCFVLNSHLNITCKEKEIQKSIIEQNLNLLFISSLIVMMVQVSITTITSLREIKIFSTEHRNKWYSTGSYFLAKMIVETIPLLVNSFCFVFVIYYMSGQYEDGLRFFKFLYITIASFLCTQVLGSSIGILFSNNESLALFIAIQVFTIFNFFNNFYIPTKTLHSFFKMIANLTYHKYHFNSMLIIIYGFGRCPSGFTPEVLYLFDINDDQIFWENATYLSINYLVFKSLEFLLLFNKANKVLMTIRRKTKPIKFSKAESNNSNDVKQVEQVMNFAKNKSQNYLESNDRKLMIAWIDLTFTFPSKLMFPECHQLRKENKLLDNISGCIEMGSLNALMGPSGAGKTTLLRCINGRINSGLSEETKIYLSSYERIKSCFITQNTCDHLLNGLTVKQTLLYASKLKNSNNNSKLNHENNINQLLLELMISDIENTKVELCSGGEQKRLVIALELTSFNKPNMLCIDEPTSGLDSNAAEVVIHCLKDLSRKHKMSIITSIHQPNNDLLMMFDNIYVLAKGGVCVYSGQPKDLKTHLNECNIICNEFQVPIEVLLKVSSKGINDTEVQRLCEETLEMEKSFISRCDSETCLSVNGIKVISKRLKGQDLWYLLLRTMTYTFISRWKASITQFIVIQLMAFMLLFLYTNKITKADGCINLDTVFNLTCAETVEYLEEKSLLSQNIKYNFVIVNGMTFLQIIITTLTFSSEVKVFLNEHQNCWYSTGAYYWAKSTVDMIPIIITFILFCWIINLYDSIAIYFGYLYLITFGVLCSQSFGHLSGIIFKDNQKLSIFFSISLSLILTLLCNIIIPLKESHYFMQWLSEFSFVKHIFQCLLTMIYGFNRCSSEQFSVVLYKYNMKDEDFWHSFIALFLHFIALKIISLSALILKSNSLFKTTRTYKKQLLKIESQTEFNYF